MLREPVLAIGIPVLLLLLAVLSLQQWGDRLPPRLQRLAERPTWLWNTGIGLIIGLSLLRWLLQRCGSGRHCLPLLSRAHRSMLVSRAHRSVRHQKRFDPFVVPPLADPIGDRGGISRHLKSLAERLGEALQLRARQPPHRGKNLLNGGRIEGLQAYLCRCLGSSAVALRSRCLAG